SRNGRSSWRATTLRHPQLDATPVRLPLLNQTVGNFEAFGYREAVLFSRIVVDVAVPPLCEVKFAIGVRIEAVQETDHAAVCVDRASVRELVVVGVLANHGYASSRGDRLSCELHILVRHSER